jgi:pimeloyl-ACP methyl ester carboxylesterase
MTRSRRSGWMAAVAVLLLAAALVAAYIGARRSAPWTSVEQLRSTYASPQSKFIDVAGVAVHYEDEGTGPTLLLLHGSFGSLRMFDDLIPSLRGQYRVIRFDQPPSGLSGPVPRGFELTPEAFVHAFLQRLGVSRTAVLGTSSGGIFAYRYAASHPEAVTALVLANVPPSAPVDNAAAQRRQSWWVRLSSLACARFATPWSETCWHDFLHGLFVRDERVTPALVQQYYDLNRHPGARQLTSIAAIMRKDEDVRGYLARVTAPTLLLWGTSSPVLPPETATLLASRLTGTQPELRRLERVAHYPPLEAPDDVAAAMLPFLMQHAR